MCVRRVRVVRVMWVVRVMRVRRVRVVRVVRVVMMTYNRVDSAVNVAGIAITGVTAGVWCIAIEVTRMDVVRDVHAICVARVAATVARPCASNAIAVRVAGATVMFFIRTVGVPAGTTPMAKLSPDHLIWLRHLECIGRSHGET